MGRTNLQKIMNDVGAFTRRSRMELSVGFIVKKLSGEKSKEKDELWNGCHTGGISAQLSEFSMWRYGPHTPDAGVPDKERAATFLLLTSCPSYGGTLGVAWRGGLCKKTPSATNGNGIRSCARKYLDKGFRCIGDVSVNSHHRRKEIWLTFAHELGHTFGAFHNCAVPGPRCSARTGTGLMSYDKKVSEQKFQEQEGKGMCALIKDRRARSSWCFHDTTPSCGNGVVDAGEECDDTSKCCDQVTCKFKGECSGGECCNSDCKKITEGQCSPEKPDDGVFEWKTGDYGACGDACIKTREVYCVDGGDLRTDDAKCDASAKPQATQSCETERCEASPPQWVRWKYRCMLSGLRWRRAVPQGAVHS